MNFNDATSDIPVGQKSPARKSNEDGENAIGIAEDSLDREAMDSAQKAQERIHKNENTNSGNTIFSK
jgi:hypothetical protein